MSETVILNGRVASGGGTGTSNTRRDAGKLRDALGITVVEGTLNIILKRPVMFANDTAVQIPVDGDREWPRLEWPGRLNGTDIWINRRAKPLHIVGLLSAVHLRQHLHLSDGDEVHIEVRKCDVARISNVGRLTWALFWLGRKNWFYTRNGYRTRAQRWCRRFGATQLATEKSCRDLARALTRAVLDALTTH